MTQRVTLHHVYFELRTYGKYLRACAIDPNSGEEAVATGLISMGEEAIKRNAKMKLEYKLTKKLKENAQGTKNRNEWIG